MDQLRYHSIQNKIEIIECQPVFCTLIELAKIGDLASSELLLSNEIINNKEDLCFVCSEEAIASNKKDMFIFYVHKRLSYFAKKRRFKKHIESLEHFFNTLASSLIQRGKTSWLKFLRVALGEYFSRRNPIHLGKQLQVAVSNNQRSCFDFLLNEYDGFFGQDTYATILDSEFCDKYKILRGLLTSISSYQTKMILKIFSLSIKREVCLEGLKEIIPFDQLSNSAIQHLCKVAISSNRLDFLKFCINDRKCDLSDELIHSTLNLSSDLQFFDRFPRRYRRYFEKKLVLKKDTLGLEELKVLTNPSILLSLMKTKEFDDWQYFKNIIFKYLFVREGLILDSKIPFEKRLQSLQAFCILIHYSENKHGLCQQDVDLVINTIIQASNDSYRKSFVKYCTRLIATLYIYGYSLHEFAGSFAYRFYFLIEDAHELLFRIVIEGCSQKNYNLLMASHSSEIKIMPLWKMSRIVVRRSIRKPFSKNLNILIEKENLPFFFRTFVNLDRDLDHLNVSSLKFSLTENNVYIYNL